MVVNRTSTWSRYVLPQGAFCSLITNDLSGSSETLIFKFLGDSSQFWALTWKFITLNARLRAGFFVEMELIGLGFRIRKIIPAVYRFFWGYANYVYLFVPTEIMLEYAAE